MKTYAVTVDDEGTTMWRVNGKFHRENGPACEWAKGDKAWYLNGESHREDGPAWELANGKKYWYLKGVLMSEESFHRRNKPLIDTQITINGVEYTLK